MLGLGVNRVGSIDMRWVPSVDVSGMRGVLGEDRSARKDERENSGKNKSIRDNHARCSKRPAVNPA